VWWWQNTLWHTLQKWRCMERFMSFNRYPNLRWHPGCPQRHRSTPTGVSGRSSSGNQRHNSLRACSRTVVGPNQALAVADSDATSLGQATSRLLNRMKLHEPLMCISNRTTGAHYLYSTSILQLLIWTRILKPVNCLYVSPRFERAAVETCRDVLSLRASIDTF